jgi:hypothetical protein
VDGDAEEEGAKRRARGRKKDEQRARERAISRKVTCIKE